jgi:PPP family 3-phenylpropionic acid transporter
MFSARNQHQTDRLPARIGFFYFTYFAGLGVMLPYFTLYFEKLGLSGFRIGALSAIVPAGKILFSTVWAYRADRAGGRRGVTIAACALSAAALLLFLFFTSFGGLVLACVALAIVDAPRLPLTEATTLELVHRDRIEYGRMRGWGSIGFILSSLATGALLAVAPTRVVIYAALGWTVLNAIASIGLPAVPHETGRPRTSLVSSLRNPGVILFLAGCLLMQASHGAYYAFFSIHMERSGFTSTTIGALWALGVAAEVAVMFFSRRFIGRVSPATLLVICSLLAAARWALLSASASLAVVVPAQLLHALTFAAFHIAAVTQTHRLFAADLRASGQSLYSALTYGAGTVAGTFGAGVIFDAAGPWLTFAASSLIALAATGLLLAFRRRTGPDEEP